MSCIALQDILILIWCLKEFQCNSPVLCSLPWHSSQSLRLIWSLKCVLSTLATSPHPPNNCPHLLQLTIIFILLILNNFVEISWRGKWSIWMGWHQQSVCFFVMMTYQMSLRPFRIPWFPYKIKMFMFSFHSLVDKKVLSPFY